MNGYRFLARLPLKRKLMLIIMSISMLGLLLAGVSFGFYERYRIRHALVNDLTAISRIIGDRSTAALLFDDPATAAQNLSVLRLKADVIAACIYNERGEPFATYIAEGRMAEFPPVALARAHRFGRSSLALFDPIVLEGKQVGTIYVLAALTEVRSIWRQYLLATVLFLVGAALGAYYLSSRLQRVVSVPLAAILEPARLVTQNKDFSVRAAKTGDPEIDLVVQAFNGMLETIETQSQRLDETVRKYRELVEHANSIILRWGADGRITFLNEYGLRFFGYSAEEIIGRHVVGTLVPTASGEGPDLEQLMARICANPEAFEQNVNENMLRDGRRVWISWTNRVVRDEQGRLQGILSVRTDVTERRKADEAIRVLNADLERRVAERTAELGARNQDLERFNRLFVDRELRMKELKQRLKELEGREPHRP